MPGKEGAPEGPTIKHNVYEGGDVQSLGFQNADGSESTVGVLVPGEYDFGIAEREEHVTATTGKLQLGEKSKETVRAIPNGFIFTKGTPITFIIEETTSYLCNYFETPPVAKDSPAK